MKTTVEIQDVLYASARRSAEAEGVTMRSLIEDGIRLRLEQRPSSQGYEIEDLRVGDPEAENPLSVMSWAEIRDHIYGGR